MTTARERLVALSGLSGVSAREHLLAIMAGGGTGPGSPVLVERMTVWLEEAAHTLVSKPVRSAPQATERAAPAASGSKANKFAFVMTAPDSQYIITEPDELWVVEEQKPTIVVLGKPQEVTTIRRRTVSN